MNIDRKIVEEAISSSKKFKPWTVLFIGPVYIGMLLFVPLYGILFGEYASKEDINLIPSVTNIEYHLKISSNFLMYLFFAFWIIYFINYLVSNRNQIKAYFYNGILNLLIFMITYYQFIVAFQFFVPFLIIRVLYWSLFVFSVVYIFYMMVTNKRLNNSLLSKINETKFKNALLLLWGINSIVNVVIGNFNNVFARVLFATFPIVPLLLIILFTSIYRSLISTLKILNTINHNQEKYRQEFGYSLEDWYGKKSQEYLESIGQTAIPVWKTVRFRLVTELVISIGLLLLIGSVHKNSDSSPLWVMLSLGFIFIVFPLDCLISLVKWLRKKFRK